MKWCVVLFGTISSLTFAQIAKLTPTHELEQQLFQSNKFYTGIYPQFKPRFNIGISQTQLVTGTDIRENQFWLLWSNQSYQNRTAFHHWGSPDWGIYQFKNSHFLKINETWSLGAGLNIQNLQPFSNWTFSGDLNTQINLKNGKLFRYGINFNQNDLQHQLGYYESHSDYSWGLFISKRGDPYQIGAYILSQITPEIPLILFLGSGSERIGIWVFKAYRNVQFQLGGIWLSPLNQMQIQFKIQYDKQKRGDGIVGRDSLSDFKGTNK